MSEVKETELKHQFGSRASYKEALNNAPKDGWIDNRSLGMNKQSTYMPIQYQQALADKVFDEWNVVDEHYSVVINEIICTVKILALPSYPNSEHETFTGSSAKPIQARKGSLPELFPKGKLPNSLEYNVPAARSAAISNALSTKGNIFGRHLGRNISSGYNMSGKKKKSKKNKNEEN